MRSGPYAVLGVACAAAALVLSACGDSRSDAEAGSGDGVLITREDASLPAGCRVSDVGSAIITALEGIGNGDADTIDRAFAPSLAGQGETAFQWYTMSVDGASDGTGGAVVVVDRDRIESYFSERFRQHERLRLIVLSVVRQGDLSVSAVGGTIVAGRSADDLPGGRGREWLAHGKYALNCDSGTLFVLSLATDTGIEASSLRSERPCPVPDGWRPDGPPVACTP